MSDSQTRGLEPETTPGSFKQGLADVLTASRGLIALSILALSVVGASAYLAVVILTLVGGATDIFDGKAARRYRNQAGKLGKYDLPMDTLLVLSVVVYFSFSGIVIPRVVGLVWTGLATTVIAVHKGKRKILILFEVPTILALVAISAIYDFRVFALLIVPAMAAGTIIERKRIRGIVTEEWPRDFSE
jgi:phosphatidylglycerophosphate synthase